MGGFMHLPRSLAALSATLLLAATTPQLAQAREIVGFFGPLFERHGRGEDQ
jgi:hypothetical protein